MAHLLDNKFVRPFLADWRIYFALNYQLENLNEKIPYSYTITVVFRILNNSYLHKNRLQTAMLKDYVNFGAKISKIGIFGSRTFTATFGPKNGAESQKNISGPLIPGTWLSDNIYISD